MVFRKRRGGFFSFLKRKKKVGLALGGGGAKGFAHFPIVNEMVYQGVKFDYVSGSSAGAIVGAYLCLNGEVESLFNEVIDLKYKDWIALLDLSYRKNKSFVKGEKFKAYLEGFFGDKTFADLKIPFVVTVVNLDSGELEYISKGRLIDAIMASSAYPGVFPVCKIDGRNYVDGGLIDNLPYRVLFEKGMDKVVAVNLSRIFDEKFKVANVDNMSEVLFRVEQISKDYISKLVYFDVSQNENLFVFEPNLRKGFRHTWNLVDRAANVRLGENEYKRRKKDFFKWLG